MNLVLKELNIKLLKYLIEVILGGEGGLMENCLKFIENEELKGNLKEVYGIGILVICLSIVKSLIDRGYLEIKKKYLMIIFKGILFCSVLENINLVLVEMIVNWELILKDILEKGY